MKDLITELQIKVAILEERLKLSDLALNLQKEEYSRRLEILNGEAEKLKTMQSSYLPREVWDSTLKELRKELSVLDGFKNVSIGRQATIATVIATLISLGFLLIDYFVK